MFEFKHVKKADESRGAASVEGSAAVKDDLALKLEAMVSQQADRLLSLLEKVDGAGHPAKKTSVESLLRFALNRTGSAEPAVTALEKELGVPHPDSREGRSLLELDQLGPELAGFILGADSARKSLGDTSRKLDQQLVFSKARLSIARLNGAALELATALASEMSQDDAGAFVGYRRAAKTIAQAVGRDHALFKKTNLAAARLSESPAVSGVKEHDENPSSTEPEIEVTKKGFRVYFRFPRSWAEAEEFPSEKKIRQFLLELCQGAEREWGRENGSIGAYDNSISEHSSFNSIADKGPKLFDPEHTYRGRISINTIGRDSIANSISKYGSDIDEKSLFHALKGKGNAKTLLRMLYGAWTIEADRT
jgi:hypothetical protein